jgi:ribosomal protein S27E
MPVWASWIINIWKYTKGFHTYRRQDNQSVMPVYSVIACPKCRKSAQLIEDKGAKTTKCQLCGTTLQIRKLRVFHKGEDIEEARAVRTKIQAQLLGEKQSTKMNDLKCPTFGEELSSLSPPRDDASVSKTIDKAFKPNTPPKIKTPTTDNVRRKKNNAEKDMMSILESRPEGMKVSEFSSIALEMDVDEAKFKDTLERMRSSAQVYFPKKGHVKIVQ